MAYAFAGEPANIENGLPTPKSVTGTTFATPIVVTTASAHGLRPGDYLTITGATDPNANGTFRAGLTATSTKVQLLDRLAGTPIAGTLAGGGAGSLQSEGFGTAYTIPEDATDDDTAASVAVGLEALGDRTAYLYFVFRSLAAAFSAFVTTTAANLALKANLASPTFTGTVSAPTVAVSGNESVGGTLAVGGNVTAAGARGVALTGSQPASNADPGANNLLIAPLVPKAWGTVTLGSSVTVDGGVNIDTLATTTVVASVTFKRAMADGNYAVSFGQRSPGETPIILGQLAAGFTFSLYSTLDFVTTRDLTAGTYKVDFSVMGRQ